MSCALTPQGVWSESFEGKNHALPTIDKMYGVRCVREGIHPYPRNVTAIKKLQVPPVFRFLDCTKQFVLTADASQIALGTVLSQLDNFGDRSVVFTSRKPTSAESRYRPGERELLNFSLVNMVLISRQCWAGKRYESLLGISPEPNPCASSAPRAAWDASAIKDGGYGHKKTSFQFERGKYEFVRIPFGLKNAPISFPRMIDYFLLGFDGSFIQAYMDDLIIFRTIEKQFIKVRNRLEEFGLKIAGDKSYFELEETISVGRFKIKTDHNPLVWARKLEETSARISGWKETLAAYDFEIVHTRGKDNVIADCLSRRVNAIEDVDAEYAERFLRGWLGDNSEVSGTDSEEPWGFEPLHNIVDEPTEREITVDKGIINDKHNQIVVVRTEGQGNETIRDRTDKIREYDMRRKRYVWIKKGTSSGSSGEDRTYSSTDEEGGKSIGDRASRSGDEKWQKKKITYSAAAQQGKIFSIIDLESGYHQIMMEPRGVEKTAFQFEQGKYEITRMPLGLKNAPNTFQKMINEFNVGLSEDFIQAYMDDLIIFSKTLEEHKRHLDKVKRRLQEFGLKISADKSSFFLQEVKIMGHIVSEQGTRPDPEKVQAVRDLPEPTNLKGLRSFLGIVNFYRRLIRELEDKLEPMTKLLKKNVKFHFKKKAKEAINWCKNALSTVPILQFPDFGKKCILTTDASQVAVGAVLAQDSGEREKPIAFASKKPTPTETRYSTIERELLGIVWAVKNFRPYLLGRQFTIKTDHKPLVWIERLEETLARVSRWKESLAAYDFEIVHIKGSENVVADCLSRQVNAQETVVVDSPKDRDKLYGDTMKDIPTTGA
ncbi:hypothetical protein AAG570_012429 [Ranatra chinensis]|uniref:RNA-directed DNA polymerase n=1 Tax=Ranatra chinensis TaxID=642074 RepID=A0ABD0YFQ8_9HEMI